MKIKDIAIIAGIFLVGVGIPLGILYAALPFAANNVYVNPFLHMGVMAAIGLFAGILSFVIYRSWRYYNDPRLFILALFLLVNGIASVIHGGTGILWPNISIHLVLYLSAPLMLGVFLPQTRLQNIIARHPVRIIVGSVVLTITAIPLLYLAIPETNIYQAETATRIFIPPLGVLLWL